MRSHRRHKGSFLDDIAVDEARKVAWPAADPSQATGRVKRHDNQLHRARVLEVRIQSPPAESPQTIGSSAVASEQKLVGFVPEPLMLSASPGLRLKRAHDYGRACRGRLSS